MKKDCLSCAEMLSEFYGKSSENCAECMAQENCECDSPKFCRQTRKCRKLIVDKHKLED